MTGPEKLLAALINSVITPERLEELKAKYNEVRDKIASVDARLENIEETQRQILALLRKETTGDLGEVPASNLIATTQTELHHVRS